VVIGNNVSDFNTNNQNLADAFDNNDNPATYKRATGWLYDSENRLTQAGSLLTAAYRGHGLRAWKTTGSVKTFSL